MPMIPADLQARVDAALPEFAKHELQLVLDASLPCRNGAAGATRRVAVYRCAAPGTNINAFELAVTPTALVLSGDFAPSKNGVVAPPGYGLEWFAGASSPSYLGEKFLEVDYHEQLAREWFADLVEQAVADTQGAREGNDLAADFGTEGCNDVDGFAAYEQKLRELQREVDYESPHSFYEAVRDADPVAAADTGWIGYKPEDLTKLCICQAVWRRLWLAHKAGT